MIKNCKGFDTTLNLPINNNIEGEHTWKRKKYIVSFSFKNIGLILT